MPLTVFDVKGIPATRREMIEAAIEKGGKHLAYTHEAWVRHRQSWRRRERSDYRAPKGLSGASVRDRRGAGRDYPPRQRDAGRVRERWLEFTPHTANTIRVHC